MRIVITGGSGYIGSRLAPRIMAEFGSVSVVDLVPPPYAAEEQLHFEQRDLTIDSGLREFYAAYDVVIHLAALVGYPICDREPDRARATNVGATELLMKYKRPAAKVFFASTVSNYGPSQSRVDETFPLSPVSLYGQTKTQAERLVAQDPQSIRYRFASAFGLSPKLRYDNLIHDFCWQAVRGETLALYEQNFIRQFIHVDDMTESIVFALKNWDRLGGQVYNVGNPGTETSKRRLVETIREFVPHLKYEVDNQGSDLERRNFSISFEKILTAGFAPRVGLREGIGPLVDFMKTKQSVAASYERPNKAA